MKSSVLRRWLTVCLILTMCLTSLLAQTPQWVNDGITETAPESNAIGTDAAGNAYVATQYAAFGILFVAKINPQGDIIWADTLGGVTSDGFDLENGTQAMKVRGVHVVNDNGTERLFVGFDSQTASSGYQQPGIYEYNPATGALVQGVSYVDDGTAHPVSDFRVGDGKLLLLAEDVLLNIDMADLSIQQQWQNGVDPAIPFVVTDISGYTGGTTVSPDFFGSETNPTAAEMPFYTGSPLDNTPDPTDADNFTFPASTPFEFGVTPIDLGDGSPVPLPITSGTTPWAGASNITHRAVVETSEGLYVYMTFTLNDNSQQAIVKQNKTDNYMAEWGYYWRQDNGNAGGLVADENNNVYLYTWDQLYLLTGGGLNMLANKFDKDGNHQWSKLYGAAGNEVPWQSSAVAIDQARQEIVLGLYTDSFNGGQPSSLLLSTNYDGEIQNYTFLAEEGVGRLPTGVALDGNANAYVAYRDGAGSGNSGVFKVNTETVFLAPVMVSATKDSDTQITITFSDNVVTNGGNPTDFTVKDGTGTAFTVSAQADGTPGDDKIVLTVADLSSAVGDLIVTYTNNNDEVSDTDSGEDQDFVRTDNTGVTIDLDDAAPTIVSATKDSDTQITVTMSEAVQTNGTNPTDFTVVDEDNTPFVVSAQTDGTAGDTDIVLTVADLSGATGDLTVTYTNNNNEISDFGGNYLATGSTTISDVIALMISEFIANPFGTENISEWVELYNYGSAPIDINGFKLKDEDSDDDVIVSTSTIIPAGGYLILTNNKSNFESIWFGGNVVSQVLQMSGITLANSSDELILTDASDNVIWSLAYADDDTEGKATWISTSTNTPTVWGSKASPGIDRDGTDNVAGSPTGYEKNSATADPLAFTNTDGDMGSPLNGTVLFASSTIDNNINCNGFADGGLTAAALGGVSPYTYIWSNGSTQATLSTLPAGTYTVTVSDAQGTTATASSSITEPTLLTANVGSANFGIDFDGDDVDDEFYDETVSCNGFLDGGLAANPAGGTAPYTYLWSIGATTGSIVGVGAGTYTVTVTDANGCTATSQGTITEPDALMANANTDMNISMFNGFDGEISSTPTGGTQPYNYIWSNGGTTASQTFLQAGTYTVTVTDANGCTASESTTVTQPANSNPAFTSSPVTSVFESETYKYIISTSDADGHDVTVTSNALPGWLSLSQGLNSITTIAGDATGGTGTTDGTGTNALFNFPMGVAVDNLGNIYVSDFSNTSIRKVDTEGVVSTFAGGTEGTADGTGTNAQFIRNSRMTIDGNNNLYVYMGGETSRIRKITPAGVVTTLANSVGQGDQGEGGLFVEMVVDHANENLYMTNLTGASVIKVPLNGDPASIFAGGGGEPFGTAILDGTGTSAIFAAPSGLAIDSNGNLYVGALFSNHIRKITPEGVVSTFVGSASLIEENGSAFTFEEATGTNVLFPTSQAGLDIDSQDNLYLMAGDFFGGDGDQERLLIKITQAGVASKVIGKASSAIMDGTGTDAAIGRSLGMSVDSDGSVYFIDFNTVRKISGGYCLSGDPSGQVGPHAIVLDASDGNTGTGQQSFTINVIAPLEVSADLNSNISCNGAADGDLMANATGGISPYSYVWSNGSTNANINNLPAGTYTVTVSDNDGNTATASNTVTQPTELTASVAGSTIDDGFGTIFDETISCNGFTDGGLTASPTGGTGPYTYTWSIGATTSSIVGIGAGTYTVTVTDANGCTTTAQGTVTEPDALMANANTDQNVTDFNGFDGEISSTPTGGTQPYNYVWSNGGTTASQTFLQAGTYTVTVTDANGCTTSESTTVNQPPNSDPEFESEPVTEVGDDEIYNYFIETSDFDGHAVNLTGTTLPSWLTIQEEVFATEFFVESEFAAIPVGAAVIEDDPQGPEAEVLAAPYGMVFDSNGDLFVGDPARGQIMKVSPEGFVSVFAGSGSSGSADGTGTEASFDGPTGLTVDSNDNLYVVDASNDAIRKITPEGVVSTLAVLPTGSSSGTGTDDEFFGRIFGIAIDPAGNLYVTSPSEHVIFKVTSGGTSNVFAGSGFKSGGGPFEGNLGDGTFADGTGTEASFNSPFGIDIDAQGNLYVADGVNGRIRKITPAGVVTTVAGSGLPFFDEPENDREVADDGSGPFIPLSSGTGTDAVFFGIPIGIKLDGNGNIYFTQVFGAAAIVRVDAQSVVETVLGGVESGIENGIGTDAVFAQPFAIDIDNFGNLFIGETFTGGIRVAFEGNVLTGDPIDQVGDHPVVLDADDGNGGTAQQSFTVTVFDNTAPEFESGTAASFAENGTGTVYTAMATDTNSKAVITYSLGQSMDSQFFSIDPTTGILTFLNPPDFENPMDDDQDNNYDVEIHASDDAQNSSDAFVVTITVTDVQEDITPPGKPVITGISDDTGASDSDGITSDKNIIISGTAEANASVEVFTQFGPIRKTQADGNGDWVLDITDITLVEIIVNLTAQAVDAAGNSSEISDIFVLTPDFTAPEKPVITGISDDTGASDSDGITNDKNILINGTAEPNTIIEVSTQYGPLRNTQADANGDWVLDITDVTLIELMVDLTAEAVDLAGNRSPSSDAFKLMPDFTAPVKPVITGITDDTGSSDSDGITNDKNISIMGTAEPNTTIEVSTQYGPIRKTQTDGNGDWILDITDITLFEIVVNLTAEAEDVAGNVSPKSDVFVLTPDFTAPEKPVITGITDDTGVSDSDGITNDKNITINGTAEPNSIVEVSTQFGPVRKTQTDANGDWVLDITDITLFEIIVNLTAKAEDVAGNISAKSDVFVLTPDFTAPAKPVITGITDDTGSSSSDGITKDKNITISGTAEPGAIVEVSTQFGPVRKTQANAGGNWILDITDITLFEIVVNLTAEAADAAGNVSPASDVFTLTPDFTAPGVTIDIANISAAGYTIIALFDEPVSGLTLGEISVTGGSASNLVQDDPMSYSFLVSLSGATADVQVTAGSAQDVAGNDNTVSNLLNLNLPGTRPQEGFNNLGDQVNGEKISLYPNPASSVLTIDLSELSADEVDVFLYDAAGTPVFNRQAYSQKTLKLDVSTYTNGMYIVQVYDGLQVIRKKVMVKK